MKRLLCTAIFVFLVSVPVFAVDYPVSAGEWSTIFTTASYTYDGLENGETHTLLVNVAGGNLVSDLTWSVVSASANAANVDVKFSPSRVTLYAQNQITGSVVVTANIRVSFRAGYDISKSPFSVYLRDIGDAGNLGFTEADIYHSINDILAMLAIVSEPYDSSAITPISYLSSADDFYIYCSLSGVSVSDGVWSLSQSSTSSDFQWNGVVDWSKPYPGNAYFIAGQQYLVSLSWPGTVSNLDDLMFLWQGRVDNPVVSTAGSGSSIRSVLSFVYTPSVNSLCTLIRFSGAQFALNPGEISWSVIPADADDVAGSAVPDEWEDTNQQLNDAASDLHAVDDTVFADINTYKGQLDFGLDSWSDAAAGLSYVGNIFLILWDNIPTQPIVLALMLGLASLLLGRGAALARRAGRGRGGGDDDA